MENQNNSEENQNNIKKKERKCYSKKNERCKNQQLEITQNIINILDPSGNNTFNLCDIDNNYDKIKQIMDILPEFKKYFCCNNIVAIKQYNGEKLKCKRPWLSLSKAILKTTRYTLINKRIALKDEQGKYIYTTKYTISKPL